MLFLLLVRWLLVWWLLVRWLLVRWLLVRWLLGMLQSTAARCVSRKEKGIVKSFRNHI